VFLRDLAIVLTTAVFSIFIAILLVNDTGTEEMKKKEIACAKTIKEKLTSLNQREYQTATLMLKLLHKKGYSFCEILEIFENGRAER